MARRWDARAGSYFCASPKLLTTRERQILQLLAEGKGIRGIAELLQISSKTVETHRMHLMDRLGLHSIAELARYAVREGLTKP